MTDYPELGDITDVQALDLTADATDEYLRWAARECVRVHGWYEWKPGWAEQPVIELRRALAYGALVPEDVRRARMAAKIRDLAEQVRALFNQ